MCVRKAALMAAVLEEEEVDEVTDDDGFGAAVAGCAAARLRLGLGPRWVGSMMSV